MGRDDWQLSPTRDGVIVPGFHRGVLADIDLMPIARLAHGLDQVADAGAVGVPVIFGKASQVSAEQVENVIAD